MRDLERQVKSLQDLQAMMEEGTQTSESLIDLCAVVEATDESPASNIPIPPPLPPILSEGGVPHAPPLPFGEHYHHFQVSIFRYMLICLRDPNIAVINAAVHQSFNIHNDRLITMHYTNNSEHK